MSVWSDFKVFFLFCFLNIDLLCIGGSCLMMILKLLDLRWER